MRDMNVKSRFLLVFVIIFIMAAAFVGISIFIHTSEVSGNTALFVLGGSGAVLLLLILIFAAVLSSSIQQPIRDLSALSSRLAQGDASAKNMNVGGGEFGQIAEHIEKISADISRVKAYFSSLSQYATRGGSAPVLPHEHLSGAILDIADTGGSIVKSILEEFDTAADHAQSLASGNTNTGGHRQARAHTRALDGLTKTLSSLQTDIDNFAQAVAGGNFGYSIPEGRYEGQWRKLAVSLNESMRMALSQVSQIEDGMNKFAKSQFDGKINADMRGEFGKIKTAHNNVCVQITKNIGDIHNALVNVAAKTRPSGDFPQDFAKLKTPITDIYEKIPAPAPIPRPSVAKPKGFSQNETASGRDKGNYSRMSGAYKGNAAGNASVKHDFTKNDFGKY
ncbi:MAG: HAMP domain-containing protein [Defluviitaleaceae bacterium]|nr:HAMP domain-containing protein [Defluviitaleaceae bacterium]